MGPEKRPQKKGLAKRLASSSFWALVGRLTSMLSVLINYRLLVDLVSPSELAIYVIASGAAGLGAMICGCGLGSPLIRRFSAARNPEPGHGLHRLGLFVQVCLISVVAWILLSWVFIATLESRPLIFGKPLDSVASLILFWAFARCALGVVTEAASGLQHFSLSSMVGGLSEGPIVNGIVMLMLIFFGSQIQSAREVLMVHLIATGVVALVALMIVYRLIRVADRQAVVVANQNPDLRPGTLALLSEGFKVLVSQLATHGIVNYETLLIGRYCDDDQINAWGLIRRLIAIVSAPLMLINAAIPSFIAELHGIGDRLRLEKLLRGASTLATPPALFGFAFLFILGDAILGAYDQSFRSANVPLVLLAAANIVFVGAGSAGLTLRMTNHQGWATLSTIVLSTTYVVFAPWCIAEYKVMGAAVLASLMIIFRNVIATVLVRYFLQIWCVPTLDFRQVKPLLSAIRNRQRRRSEGNATGSN